MASLRPEARVGRPAVNDWFLFGRQRSVGAESTCVTRAAAKPAVRSCANRGSFVGEYLYLYRDGNRRPVYVGRGEQITRAESHMGGTHNAGLAALIASGISVSRPPGLTGTSASLRR
jgi:hypothetical protein